MSESFRLLKNRLLKTAHVAQQHEHHGVVRQWKWNRMLGLTLLIGSVVYLIQINMIATQGYAMKEIENKIAVVGKENEDLRVKMFEAQKLDTILVKADTLGLKRSDHMYYLVPKNSVAAVR